MVATATKGAQRDPDDDALKEYANAHRVTAE